MIAVYCFSGAGHSWNLAEWVADRSGAPVCRIGTQDAKQADVAVVVFPVYCQNIPQPVRRFLPTLAAEHVVLLATYGGISPGNVLQEAARAVAGTVIAAAAVPTGHSLLGEPACADYSALTPLFDRMAHPKRVKIPRLLKNPFSDVFPSWRSRIGVAMRCTPECTHCKRCELSCPQQAMHDGRPDHSCIRCLRCVGVCPENALQFSARPVTKCYLRRRRSDRWYIFL